DRRQHGESLLQDSRGTRLPVAVHEARARGRRLDGYGAQALGAGEPRGAERGARQARWARVGVDLRTRDAQQSGREGRMKDSERAFANPGPGSYLLTVGLAQQAYR